MRFQALQSGVASATCQIKKGNMTKQDSTTDRNPMLECCMSKEFIWQAFRDSNPGLDAHLISTMLPTLCDKTAVLPDVPVAIVVHLECRA